MVKFKFYFIFLALVIFSSKSYTEEAIVDSLAAPHSETTSESTPRRLKYFEYLLVSIDHTQWLEKINFQFAGLTDEDKANFSGLNLNLEQGTSFTQWGWSLGASLGSGKASGGGNSSIILYQKGNQAWTTYGGFAKLYYRITPQVSLGASVPVFLRTVSWETPVSGLSVDSGRRINIGLLLDLSYRLSKIIDFYQSFGLLNFAEGSTLWKIGLGYRL